MENSKNVNAKRDCNFCKKLFVYNEGFYINRMQSRHNEANHTQTNQPSGFYILSLLMESLRLYEFAVEAANSTDGGQLRQ